MSRYQNVYKSSVDSKYILNIFLGQILRKLDTNKETAGFDFYLHTYTMVNVAYPKYPKTHSYKLSITILRYSIP